jgi:hypothetical protein
MKRQSGRVLEREFCRIEPLLGHFIHQAYETAIGAGQEGRILAFAALSRRSGVPFIRWAYETDNEAGQEGRILAFAAPRCWTKP